MERIHCQKSMGHIAQQFDVEAPIIFFKYGWLLEEKFDENAKNDVIYLLWKKIPTSWATLA